VLPYLTPMAAQPMGVWREGKVLIVAKETVLPPTCVKCNRPSDGRPIRRKFWWYPPAWLLLILVPYGVLLCFIVVLIIRKSGVVHYSMCEAHRRRRWAWGAGGLALSAVGLGGAVYVASQDAFQWMSVGLVTFIAGLVVAVVAQSLRPKRIDAHYVWLKGAGEEFLAQFPVAPKP
jgi:hypothetical protein